MTGKPAEIEQSLTLVDNPPDWRGATGIQLIDIVKAYDILPGTSKHIQNLTLVNPELPLPQSSKRLYDLNQVSPLAKQVLDFEATRGKHTDDTITTTHNFLIHLSQETPEFFAELLGDLISKYRLSPEAAISHCVQYMERHDFLTLAFQGALHGVVQIDGKGYDEDVALLEGFDGNPAYKVVSDLLFDKDTLEYYEANNLDIDIIKQIAHDAIEGNTLLGKMLKKGEDCPPIDWLTYTNRDFDELMRVFAVGRDLPFSEQVEGVLSGLQATSISLEKSEMPNLPPKTAGKSNIEDLLPADMVRLRKTDDKLELVYDGKSIFETYIKHIILRLFFSGSPWIRGTHSLIHDYYGQPSDRAADDLIGRLLHNSEAHLLAEDLKEVLPDGDWTPVSDWHYSPTAVDENDTAEKFAFKDIDKTLVDVEGVITTFVEAFPDLKKLITKIKGQNPLYLKQH